MTAGIHRAVVDASVGAKLFVPEALSDRAQALFEGLASDPPVRLHAPDLFFAECANTLWKHVRRSGLPAAEARRAVRSLRRLAVRATPTADLVEAAMPLALDLGISVYDACYAALADRLRAPLVTADERLVKRLRDGPHDARWLGDLDPVR